MKKPIAFLLTLTLLLSSFPIASALDSTNENKAETISAEEFFQAIQDEYAKFHIGYTAEGYDPSATFTQDFLNERLNDIRSRMSSVTNYSEELQSFVEIIPEPEPLDTAVPNAVMPYKKTYSMTKTIKSPSNMGAADIYAEVDTTIDAQYNVFMSIDDMTTNNLDTPLILNPGPSMMVLNQKYGLRTVPAIWSVTQRELWLYHGQGLLQVLSIVIVQSILLVGAQPFESHVDPSNLVFSSTFRIKIYIPYSWNHLFY